MIKLSIYGIILLQGCEDVKKRTIIDIIIMILLLILLIFLGTRDYDKNNEVKDSKRFDKDYSMVSSDNVFKYVAEEEVLDILNKGNGIIFMGFKESQWSNYYAKLLNEAALNTNINEIYYYDFLMDREKKSVIYNRIVDLLKDYLTKDDMGVVNIKSPCLIIMKDGNVISFDDETSITKASVTPNDYWTPDKMTEKKQLFENMFISYQGGQNGGEE